MARCLVKEYILSLEMSFADLTCLDVIRGSKSGNLIRRPLSLTVSDKLFLALGCCKGVQALHSFSAELCHRDIKSFNFLGLYCKMHNSSNNINFKFSG